MMSATKSQFENRLIEEAEKISQVYYGKCYAELDERQQELMQRSASANLREKCADVEPGVCYGCGKSLPFDKTECRACHDPFDSPGQYYFNGRWELMF
jgi:hypothetical protein